MLKIARAGQTTQSISNIVGQAITVGGCGDFMEATGGTVYTVNDYKIHKFTSSDDFVVVCGGECEVLVIGSGGGGGGLHGCGAGAGGAIYHASHSMISGTYGVVIGAGGAKGVGRDVNGSNGVNSTFDGFTGFGGGYGASSFGGGSAKVGGDGGCAGGTAEEGESSSTQTSNNGGTGYGQDGVDMDYANGSLSAGSGLFAIGAYTTSWTGAPPTSGGDGLGGTNNSTFNSILLAGQAGVEESAGNWYIGGGGNSMGNTVTVPIGGKGGGGNGGTGSGGNSLACTVGVANTGSGGGGGYTTTFNGANGGSGIALMRYKFQ